MHEGSRVAYITLCANPEFLPGVRCLSRSLVQTGTDLPLICLVPPELESTAQAHLAGEPLQVLGVEPLTLSPQFVARHTSSTIETAQPMTSGTKPAFHSKLLNFLKLRTWQLTQFDKAVFLDADVVVMRSIDQLLELPPRPPDSGSQPFAQPAPVLRRVAQTIMQTTLAALPKLPVVWHQPVAPPVGWTRRLEQKLCAVFGCIGDQHAAARDHFALGTGPGADARIQRAAVEIIVALLVADFFYTAFDSDNTFKFHPVKLQGSVRIARKFASLAAVVIGIPNDSARVIALDQDHAGTRTQVAANRGQRHRVGFGDLSGDGFFEPLLKLTQGIGLARVFAQLGALIAFAQVGDGLGGHAHSAPLWHRPGF